MAVRRVRFWSHALILLAAILAFPRTSIVQEYLPIGQIQGRGAESAHRDQVVRFRGIVTGTLEDENSRGTRFYTVFVQDLPGSEDGDPLTSDGIAIFAGARRPMLASGDIATFSGKVTEFYGLTELDNNELYFSIESRNNPLPVPAELNPPEDNEGAAAYFEKYEAMRVSLPRARVVGPSHVGCGFSVVRADVTAGRIIVGNMSDPVGQIVGVLHPSDVDCHAMPDLAYGDEIDGLVGPLTFHFDRFKIVYQDPDKLKPDPVHQDASVKRLSHPAGAFVVASFNMDNYFDTFDDTGNDAEPKPSEAELALKQAKLSATINEGLGCPAVIGLQEVENAALLAQLATSLSEPCGFRYEITHLESPDARGADLALMSEPSRVTVRQAILRQACTDLDTGVIDLEAGCLDGQQPLFSRPPLQVTVSIDGQDFAFLVNHFKSKRDGAEETAPRRLAQAAHIRRLAEEFTSNDPTTNTIVLGDFNDYDGTEVMDVLLEGGVLLDALQDVPADSRYSYIFDGASQLIDWILVSPGLTNLLRGVGILHVNADFPYRMGTNPDPPLLPFRSSDHDVPYIVVDLKPEAESTSTARTSTRVSSVLAVPSPTSFTMEATHDSSRDTPQAQGSIGERTVYVSPSPHLQVTRQLPDRAMENGQLSPVGIWVLVILGVIVLGIIIAGLNYLWQRR